MNGAIVKFVSLNNIIVLFIFFRELSTAWLRPSQIVQWYQRLLDSSWTLATVQKTLNQLRMGKPMEKLIRKSFNQ